MIIKKPIIFGITAGIILLLIYFLIFILTDSFSSLTAILR